MRIINTIESAKRKRQSAKIKLFLIFLIPIIIFGGCSSSDTVPQAQKYEQQSRHYYEQAVSTYQKLISQGKDLDKLYFALGRLYYSHGEFEKALPHLEKTNLTDAFKLRAIAYYQLGRFTDALEIFDKNKIQDDEYLYYHGLTCEKLNLFDEAVRLYTEIQDIRFANKAREQIDSIQKQEGLAHIKEIDSQTSALLENAPSEEEYPQAGALILSCDEKVELSPEGTKVTSLHYIIKILNERGKQSFAEAQIGYDSTYEKVELEYARTIRPDGIVVDVGSRHIRDVSKYLNFPLYSNARVYIISFPEIVEGASIEYNLKIYSNKLINKKDLVLNYPLASSDPIISANFSVSVPKERTLNIKVINEKYNDFQANLKPEVKEEGGFSIYAWQFKNIPQILPEANMPPNVEVNPTLLITTCGSWDEIYKWWWPLAKDKIKADDSIKNTVQDLVKGLDSDEAKIRAIYNFCAQKIRYVAVEYGQAGYEPHQAADIFSNKYGDCKDQAILLVTMLKEAGFNAWPVLIATKDYYNLIEDFPALFFNHCIAAVNMQETVVFLDPTAETCPLGDLPPDDQGRNVLLFKEDAYQIKQTPLSPAAQNLVKQVLKIKVNSDETITAEKTILTRGAYDQAERYWLLYTPPQLIEEALKQRVQETSIGATLEGYDVQNLDNLNAPVVLKYSFKGPEYFLAMGNLRMIPQLTAVDVTSVAKDKRKYDIDLDILDSQETDFEIEIPEGLAIKYMPQSVNKDSPWLTFLVEYTQENNKIFMRQRTELKKNRVYESEYQDFKNFMEGLAKEVKQGVVLEKANERQISGTP